MSVSYTMGSTKPFLIVILLSIYIQNIQCKDLGDEIKPINDLLDKPYPLATRDRDLRGVLEQIKNAAQQIRKRALASWNILKRVAEGTRREIQKWINSVRQYAIKLEKSLEDELQAWWGRLQNIIVVTLGAGPGLEQCVYDVVDTISQELTELGMDVSSCLAKQLRNLQPIKSKQERIIVNDTLFIADLDRKLDACKANKENYKECLSIVGDLVSEDIEEKYNEIQNTSIELRGLADNTRASLVDCVIQIADDVASFLLSELMNILSCLTGRRESINQF